MTDHDLEQRLRAWYRAEIDDRESAPFQLRADLAGLGQTAASTHRRLLPEWRLPAMLRTAPLAVAAAAVIVIALVGIGLLVQPPDVGPSPASASPSAPAASATESEVVYGWPTTGRNPAGVYSWDGPRCGPSPGSQCSVNSTGGFMHNGYGSGDVEIRLEVGGATSVGGGTPVTVAGHEGTYRRIDAQREEWTVEIEGTSIAIHLTAEPGTSEADLAEAHAIIDSMHAEPEDYGLRFRLVFTLTTNDWDSG